MHPSFSLQIDPIEVARGAIASLSVTPEGGVHEIHRTRIQEVFERANFSSEAVEQSLNEIRMLREAEHLGNGYWLPTPTRAVILDETASLLVSIVPTIELKRHFPNMRRAGVGRVVSSNDIGHLSTQSLKSWLGIHNIDAVVSTQQIIRSSMEQLTPSIAPVDIEVFGIKSKTRSGRVRSREPDWLSPPTHHALSWNGVSLFRASGSFKYRRYFLGRQTKSGEFQEGPKVEDNFSVQYGLAALCGKPLTVAISSEANTSHINVPLRLPESINRLLNALCQSVPGRSGWAWRCSPEYLSVVKSTLQNFGCEVSNNE